MSDAMTPGNPQHSPPQQLPPKELERLEEIAALGVLSPDLDSELQDLTDEAATALDLPVALVSIITDSVQFFHAAHGLPPWLAAVRGTPKPWSFCQHAVDSGEAFVVEDAAKDPRVRHSPLVTQDGIACYLGVPLRTKRGNVLGTLCVIGTEPRSFTAADQAVLEGLATTAIERIESRLEAPSGDDL